MKYVYSWLKDYVDLDGISPDDLAARWTLVGLEVEGVEKIGDWWDRERIIVGEVTWVGPHPNADRLVLADVNYGGSEPHRVVTGAPNLLPYRETGTLPKSFKVVFAREGAELFDGHAEGQVKMVLKGRPVRGVMSDAMVCSEKELGLSEAHEGILILPDDAPVGMPLADYLGDAVIEVETLANFARAMNMIGAARETAAVFERPFTAPTPALPSAGDAKNAADLVDVVIEDADLCPRYSARIIRDVTIGPSPAQMARRLTLAGMRPISNVVDVSNYVMLEWGEPLHAFDYDVLVRRAGVKKPTIIVRRAKPGERMVTLDGVDRALDPEMLLICDTAGPIAIAGVMGGAETEVTDETRTILLEAAAFNNLSIRRTTKLLKLPSEASARFGRGVHPALIEPASMRASSLMAELAGGSVVPGVVDAYPGKTPSVQLALDPAEVVRVLGVDIPTEATLDILRRLEFKAESRPDGSYLVTVPDHRLDVALPVDLIEEVVRIYGYDRLPSTLMKDPLPPQRNNPRLELEEAARDALVGAGLQEVIGYRLWGPNDESRLRPPAMGAGAASQGGTMLEASAMPGSGLVQGDSAPSAAGGTKMGDAGCGHLVLANPISPERSTLRRSILVSLMDSARSNLRTTDRIALFELGSLYHPRSGEPLPNEQRRIGIVLAGPSALADWRDKDGGRPFDFFHVKGIVESLLAHLGVEASYVPDTRHDSLHPGRAAALYAPSGAGPEDRTASEVAAGSSGSAAMGGSAGSRLLLGHIGELHPLVRDQLELGEQTVAVADLDLDAIASAIPAMRAYAPFSTFPAARRDLALEVPEEVAADDVRQAIVAAGGALLVDARLFDVYRGTQVQAGHKSLAFSLTFQAPDKTLAGDSVDKLREHIGRQVAKRLGAAVR